MRALPIVLLLAISAGQLAAQAPNPLSLTVGDQIRLPQAGHATNNGEGYVAAPAIPAAPVTRWVNGQVTMLGADGFSFKVDGEPQVHTRPYVSLGMIDVKRRVRRDSMISGALWGLYLGAAAGAISGPFAAKTMPIDTGASMALFGAAGGLGGAFLGTAVGALRVPSRWYRYVFR